MDEDRCSNGCVCTEQEKAESGNFPFIIEDGEGNILAAYDDEETRDDELATLDWPDGAAPAYINLI